MSIRIDGTNTAANPGITGADTDTGLQFGTNEVSIITGGTSRVTVDSDGNTTLPDDGNLTFGANDDFRIYHNGSSGNYIDVYNKDLYIRCNLDAGITGGDIILQPKSGENSAIFRDNGAVELYHDNAKKLETYSEGIEIFGDEGGSAGIRLTADEGDDDGDSWRINSNQDANDLTISNNSSGSYTDRLTIGSNGLSLGNSATTYNEIANANDAAKMHIGGGGSGGANIEVHGANHSSNAKVITMDTDGSERLKIAANGRITAQVIYGTPLSGTTRDVFIEDGGQLGYISSVRDSKTNITLLSNVDWIYQLQPSSFNYKLTDQEGAYTGEVNPELEYGLIAEDVEPVAPELCFYDEVDGEQELRGIHYKKLIVPMLKALQEASTKITTLEAKVAALEATE